MNFCKESDLYTSLYIDDLLDENDKKNFLKHLEECPQCAQKLKEESYFAELCKNSEAAELPDNFSESLHTRLLEVSEKEYNTKKKSFVFNKRVMAGLSTAAVVTICLIAYSLLPNFRPVMDNSSSKSEGASQESTAAMTEDNADLNIQFDEAITAGNGSSTDGGNPSGDSTASVNSVPSATFDKAEAPGDTASDTEKQSSQAVDSAKRKGSAARKTAPEENTTVDSGTADDNDDSGLKTALCVTMTDQAQNSQQQYFSNYVEMNLSVTSAESEMDKLKLMMSDFGASEQSSGMLNGFMANTNETSAYIDYSIPLSMYGSLQSEGLLKYKLELRPKTDIIKNDITDEYNELASQKLDIENKISEALIKGEDTSTFEAEKSALIKKINELTAKSHMITVRIFFVKK